MGLFDKQLTIYVDMDGVICNFIQSAIEAHEGVSPVGDLSPSEIYRWDFFEEYGLTWAEFFAPINEWKDFWRYIPAYDTAHDFLDRLRQMTADSGLNCEIVFCSAPIDTEDCYSGKLTWLKTNNLMQPGETLMLVKDKTKLIRPDAILIDDRQSTVDAWRTQGAMGVLYPRQWNKAGLTLVEGHPDSEEEAVDIALENVKCFLDFRNIELTSYEGREPMSDNEDLDELFEELEGFLPLKGDEEVLPNPGEGPHFFNIDKAEGLDSLVDFLKSFSEEDDLEDVEAEFCDCESGCENCLTPEALQDTAETVEDAIEEALKEVTPEDGEVRSVSSTGGEKGTKLARFDLIPIEPLTELAKHFGRGSLKYDDHNYRKGYEWSKSYAACLRHLTQFWNGEDFDEETGTPHVISAAWHCFALYEFMLHHPDFDDRYDYGE